MTSLASRAAHAPFAALHESLGGPAAGLLVAAATDLSLVIDAGGVIREAVFGEPDLAAEGCADWLGRPWIDTVTVESRPKINALLRDAATGAVTRWRQVNHPSGSGADLPIRYASMRLAPDGPIIAIGRNLRSTAALQRKLAETQQALERDYLRLRGAETRYRMLFQLASEAVLVVDAATRRVTEVNPAAVRLLGRPEKRILGQDAVDLFDDGSARDLAHLFTGLRITGQAGEIEARLGQGRGGVQVAASLFRQDSTTSALLRLSGGEAALGQSPANASVLDVVAGMPEGFVVTDLGHRVLAANGAFLDLAQVATEEQARGESLDRWLGREETEASALFATLREHGAVRNFTTVLRGSLGSREEVEVAGVSVPQGDQPCLGFTIRSAPRRVALASAGGHELPRSVEQMTELVGRVSMKNLVRETTDLIERLCIEAALRITRDNRASAAEMLGLSRQGLYAKLRRYGIGDLDAADAADEGAR
ncbi:transcriptional regulator PpsR [Methylobacterium sp. A54F]